MKKNKTGFIIFCIILIVGVIFLSVKKRVGIGNIEEVIPEEIKVYYLNGELKSSNIEKIEIIKQDTEGDYKTIECEIELKDDILTRLAFFHIELRHYDQGGWIAENYYPYQEEEIISWDKGNADFWMQEEIDELEYASIKLVNSNISDYDKNDEDRYYFNNTNFDGNQKVGTYEYTADEDFEYVNVSGKITGHIILGYNVYANDEGDYAISYSTKIEWDTTELKKNWKIEGSWYAAIDNGFGRDAYRVSMDFTKVDGTVFKWYGKAEYDKYNGSTPTGEVGEYTDSREIDFAEEKIYGIESNVSSKGEVFKSFKPEGLKAEIYVYIGYPNFYVTFTANKVTISYGIYRSSETEFNKVK